ncbi:MAG TPA: hypothetical protein VHX19_06200 [Stellaceae bacterium]|jgi:hypothetical protein|nr:hypothetical protein [Stellaceae bacterium]
MADSPAEVTPYKGPIELGMVFDFEPGKKNAYERLTITKLQGKQIWAFGRSGETFHDEDDFRKVVIFVADKPITKPKPVPVPLGGRYEGPIEPGMVFDYETGKKHAYERMTITKRQGDNIWARGRGGESFHYEKEFRDCVAFVPPEKR